MHFEFRRRSTISRLPVAAFASKYLEVQILPNPYVRIGAYDLALDRDRVIISTPRISAGYILRSGFHFRRHGA